MNEIIKSAREAMSNQDVQKAAQTLARYNLGICIPHMHDVETGEIVQLASGRVSCERDLRVSFEEVGRLDDSMVPVAWRWNGRDMEVCSSCCPTQGPEPY